MGHCNDIPFSTAHTLVFKLLSPPILVFGIYGNIMTMIIIYRLRKHYKAFTSLFIGQSALHLTLLVLCLLPKWIECLAQLRLGENMKGNWVCYFDTWIKYTLTGIASWFEMIMTTLKMAVVVWPSMPRAKFVKKIINVIVVIAIIMQIVWSSNVFLGLSVDVTKCYLGSKKHFKRDDIGQLIVWLNILNIIVLPFIVIIANDIVLSTKLRWSMKFTSRNRGTASYRRGNSRKSSIGGSSVTVTTGNILTNFRAGTARTITCIVMVAAFFYFLSWCPMFLYEALLVSCIIKPNLTQTALDVLTIIFFFSFSTNFYIYYFTGRRFRKEYQQYKAGIATKCWRISHASRKINYAFSRTTIEKSAGRVSGSTIDKKASHNINQ